MITTSTSPRAAFDIAKSPYYQSIIAFKKRAPHFSNKMRFVKESMILQQAITERKKAEETLTSAEHRIHKLKRKEQEVSSKLRNAKSKSELLSITRRQLEEVSFTQLDAIKQKKREEALEALLQKRKEILAKRLEQEEKITSTKAELLEEKRVGNQSETGFTSQRKPHYRN